MKPIQTLRRVLVPLLEEFKKRIPLLYDDLEPLTETINLNGEGSLSD